MSSWASGRTAPFSRHKKAWNACQRPSARTKASSCARCWVHASSWARVASRSREFLRATRSFDTAEIALSEGASTGQHRRRFAGTAVRASAAADDADVLASAGPHGRRFAGAAAGASAAAEDADVLASGDVDSGAGLGCWEASAGGDVDSGAGLGCREAAAAAAVRRRWICEAVRGEGGATPLPDPSTAGLAPAGCRASPTAAGDSELARRSSRPPQPCAPG